MRSHGRLPVRTHRKVRAIGALLAGCLLLLLGGCLKVENLTTLAADGSGTFRRTEIVDVEKVGELSKALRERLAALGLGGVVGKKSPLGTPSPTAREKLIRISPGIRGVKTISRWSSDRKTHRTRLEVQFRTLEGLFASGAVEGTEARLQKTKDGAWLLTLRYTCFETEAVSGEDTEPSALGGLRKAILQRLKPHMGDFVVVNRLTLPTAVIETNGTKDANSRGVTWRLGFDDLATPEKWVLRVKFADGKDLKLKAFPK